MSTGSASRYGDAWSDVYDDWFGDLSDTSLAVSVLAELAAGGTALEAGAGTGRLAVPLAATGITVIAVESSSRMAQRLQAKAHGLPVRLVVGDVLDVDWSAHLPPTGLALAYLSCNTLYQLPDQQTQLRCLARLAADLATGGLLVVEASVPNLTLLSTGRATSMRVLPDGRIAVTAVHADPAQQRISTDTVVFAGPQQHVLPVRERYIWPAELDLMARLAGLQLHRRWSGWERGPFTTTSTGHVTVYRKPAS